jgi:hypothetical protein
VVSVPARHNPRQVDAADSEQVVGGSVQSLKKLCSFASIGAT